MNLKDQLKQYFYDRSPNSILTDNLYAEFSQISKEKIDIELLALENGKFLVLSCDDTPNPRYPSLARKAYRINDEVLGEYPIKTQINIGGICIPRLIDGDRGRAEDVNNLFYGVNRLIDTKVLELKTVFDAYRALRNLDS